MPPAIQDESEETSPFRKLLKIINSGLSLPCSIVMSPFRLAYFGLYALVSEQSVHKKANRRRIRALREEHPSRQSLRLKGMDAENYGQLSLSKRNSRPRRSRYTNIVSLDLPEHVVYTGEKHPSEDDESIITNFDEEEQEHRNVFLPLLIILLILPLAIWLCYGLLTVGPQAVLERTLNTISLVPEYSSQLVTYGYHGVSNAIMSTYEFVAVGLTFT